jgi:hypothetical protein
MNKPMTIMHEDFKQELANLINNSGLPAFVIEPILRDYLNEIRLVAQKQYLADKSDYEESLSDK